MNIQRMQSTERMSKINIHNNTIYLCGQTAGADEWDITEQTKRCLTQIEDLIKEAGSDCDRLLSVTIYIKDMQDFAAMNAVWDAWVADKSKPARACVQAQMARENVLVEFSVIGAL
jgi:enamine deaminase RidA (YjgF/YER057c/UK114 family)